jgi:hypothetical protein
MRKKLIAAAQAALTDGITDRIEQDELYRLPAAANRWNVSLKCARTWVSQGRVAHVRLGSGINAPIRVPLSEINRIIAEGFRPAKSA